MIFKDSTALLRKRFHIPKERPIRRAISNFSLAERAVFYTLCTIFVLSGITLIWKVSAAYLVSVPIEGGTLVEGVVGNPRFINPVLALSEADKNLTSLVYSGLVRITETGETANDLASDVNISDDGLVYTVTLNPEARFHDGTAVTADDVVYTIQKIEDPLIKSPRRGNWEGVVVEKVDDLTVKFTLKKPYPPFIYNLTTGILPKHIWKNVTDEEFSFSQFNTLPVGSGPYQVDRVERNQGGIPDYYRLTPFKKVLGQAPFIKNLVFSFYASEDQLVSAYNNGDVESIGGISPEMLSKLKLKGAQVIHAPLPRIFAVFFNTSASKVLALKEVRQALDLAAPKEEIVTDALGGYASPISGALPAGLYPWTSQVSATTSAQRLEEAKKLLAANGWKPNSIGVLEKKSGKDTITLSFSISTGDAPELKNVAQHLVSTWQSLGAQVDLLVYETGELNQSVIRPRHFDALLFGEVVGRDADLYPFWHSSQRTDPGLNIALYANSRADKFLELARSAQSREEVEEDYRSFSTEISKDIPAVFLYSPSFLYVMPEKVQDVSLKSLSVAQDRFLGIRNWYIETDKVWKIFLN